MKNKYFLLGYQMTERYGYKLIDNVCEETSRRAIERFRRRNDFEKLMENHELIITKMEKLLR